MCFTQSASWNEDFISYSAEHDDDGDEEYEKNNKDGPNNHIHKDQNKEDRKEEDHNKCVKDKENAQKQPNVFYDGYFIISMSFIAIIHAH